MQFNGSDSYISTEDLSLAVNSSIILQRPLLIKGEPGTGKTMLAEEVAASLGKQLIQWHIKSTTKAQQGLYCLLYTSPSPRDQRGSRMPSSA